MKGQQIRIRVLFHKRALYLFHKRALYLFRKRAPAERALLKEPCFKDME